MTSLASLHALTHVLRSDDYEILTAASAKQGFDLLAIRDVQVVLSDQRMAEMSGTEFLARVRELYPDTVRLVLSGDTDHHTITESINRGAIYKFLSKPWENEHLRAIIQEAFRQQKLGRMSNRSLQPRSDSQARPAETAEGLESTALRLVS